MTGASRRSPIEPGASPKGGWQSWLGLLAILAGVVAFRVRLLDLPLERDEGGYAYFGQRLLAGVPPFASGHTMHMPGTTAAYALFLALFGETVQGIRMGLALVATATVTFVFLAGRRLHGRLGGTVAGLSYAMLATSPALLGFFGHATQLVVLFASAGLWAFVVSLRSRNVAVLAAAGLLLGLAPVMKQSGAVFPAFALCWLAFSRWRAARVLDAPAIRELAVLLFSALVPTVLTFGLLGAAGVLPEGWHWMFTYARAYSGMQTVDKGMEMLAARAAAIVPSAVGFLGLAGVGLSLRGVNGREDMGEGRAFLASLLAFSTAAVVPGLYFRQHYFVAILPAIALTAGRGVAQLAIRPRPWPFAAAAALAVAVGIQAYGSRDAVLAATPRDLSRIIYGANPFPESEEIARYVASQTRPDDRIAVLGSEPQIYFLSARVAATRHLYLYPLLEPNPYGPEMRAQLMKEVDAAAPRIIVWVTTPASWDTRVGAARGIVAWANELLASRYVLVGRVAIRGPMLTDFSWDQEAERQGTQGASVLVFRRRD